MALNIGGSAEQAAGDHTQQRTEWVAAVLGVAGRAVFWKSVKVYIHWQFEKLLNISAHFDSFSLPWMP